MPQFYKNSEENKNNNFNTLNNSKQVLIFDLYWRLFTKNKLNNIKQENDYKQVFKNHVLLFNKLKKLSEEFVLIVSDDYSDKSINDVEKIDKILYFGLIPLDLQTKNILFLKYLKFHSYFNKFNLLYGYNQFEDFLIDENVLRDYLTKNLLNCLHINKKTIKIKNYSDFQLISLNCVKERLMLFNFLTENKISMKLAKSYINSLYMTVFNEKQYNPDLSKDLINKETNKKYKVENFINFYSKNKLI